MVTYRKVSRRPSMTKSELIQCLEEAVKYYMAQTQEDGWSDDVLTLFAGYVLAYDRVLTALTED
jgi:hypothetical protein